jgi:hypothetical protein
VPRPAERGDRWSGSSRPPSHTAARSGVNEALGRNGRSRRSRHTTVSHRFAATILAVRINVLGNVFASTPRRDRGVRRTLFDSR